MKKILPLAILVFLIIGLLIPDSNIPINAQENLMMHESKSLDLVNNQTDHMDISRNYMENFGDFTANYIKDTYFKIKVGDTYFYNQGYYLTVNSTGEKVFCIEPDAMIGEIEDNSTAVGKYSELNKMVQANISDIIRSGLEMYENTNDEEYLVATQIMVWEQVGAEVLDISDNITEKSEELEKIKEELRNNLNNLNEDESLSENSNNSTVEENINDSELTSDMESLATSDGVVSDSSEYVSTVEQYVTEGQDVVTVNEDIGFTVSQEVSDENGDNTVTPNESLEYSIKIENNLEDNVDFLVSEEDYNKYLSVSENDEILVSDKSYKVEDLLSSNFIIEDVAPGSEVEFSFQVNVDSNYDGEIVKNKIEVCNTLDDGCTSSETKIMGSTVTSDLENFKGVPYATILEEDVTSDTINVSVVGADVNNLLEEGVSVNLYLNDEIVDSKPLSFSDYEDEYFITFDNNILSGTEYSVAVEGKYIDPESEEVVEGVLKDGTPQNVDARISVETEKTGNEPEIGDIRVNKVLKELTSDTVKFEISIDNPSNDEIDSGKIIFSDKNNNEIVMVLTNDNIDRLLDGDALTLKQEDLLSETKYNASYEFYDSSNELIAAGDIGEIETDTDAPTFSFDSMGNIVDSESQTAYGTINVSNKQSIINSDSSDVTVSLIEYDSEENKIREEEQVFTIDDTTDTISYSFAGIIPENNYDIFLKTQYNVDMMFDNDRDEGNYEEKLISFTGDGDVLYEELTAVYAMENAIVDSSTITVSFEIQNPESKIIDDTSMSVRACKVEDLTSCSDPIMATLDDATYTVTIIGLEGNEEYKLIANAMVSDDPNDTPKSRDIPGANNTDIFSTSEASSLEPPTAIYTNTNVNNDVMAGGISSVESTLEVLDNNAMVSTGSKPEVYVYSDINGDGIFDLGDDEKVGKANVEEKTGAFNTGKYTVKMDNLEKGKSYQFFTKVQYDGSSTYTAIGSENNTFNTKVLGSTYVEYNTDKTYEGPGNIKTEFKLIDNNRQAGSIGEVSVYTDYNGDGLVNENDERVDANVDVNPLSGLTYSVSITGLENDTIYQLHNEIGSSKDNRVYEVNSYNNVFRTETIGKEEDSDYNFYLEPEDNVIDSYTQTTAQIEVGLDSKFDDLNNIDTIDIKFVNSNNMMDTEVVTLSDDQINTIKNGESVNLYISGLEKGSSYMVYAVLGSFEGDEIVKAPEEVYTDYDSPHLSLSNKEVSSDEVEFTVNIDDKSFVKSVKAVYPDTLTSQNVEISNYQGRVKFDNLEPNKEYNFKIIYNYIIDNEHYMSSTTKTEEISINVKTDIGDKIVINSCRDLQNIQDDITANYYLGKDIDCGGEDFEPIANFSGVLDGQGNKISNLEISEPKLDYVGFISNNSGSIRDVKFENVKILGNNYVGLVANNTGNIENVDIKGLKISGNEYVGSFAGINSGKIDEVSSDATIDANDYAGGIVGLNSGTMSKTKYTGSMLSSGENIDVTQKDEEVEDIKEEPVAEDSEELEEEASDEIISEDENEKLDDDLKTNEDNLYNYIKNLIEG